MPIDIKCNRFRLLNDFSHGSISRISEATGIPKATLSRWRTNNKGGDKVRGYTNGDPKTSFTVIGKITNSGKKLVPIVLAKGKLTNQLTNLEYMSFQLRLLLLNQDGQTVIQ